MYRRVLLVSPPYFKPYAGGDYQQVQADSAPPGLGALAAYVMRELPQTHIRIVDYGVQPYNHEAWWHEMVSFQPDVVGVSVLTLGYAQCMELVRLAKSFNPGILTVAGGPHATVRPEECLEGCDVVVRGEGELTFVDLLEGHRLETIDGICYKRDGRVVRNPPRERIQVLDELPMPVHGMFQCRAYKQYPAWGVIGSRGCAYNCLFCASPNLWERTVKLRSPARLVDEIEHLHRSYGVSRIVFQDDAINLSPQRALEVCDEIIRRGLHRSVSFECQARANRACVSLDLFLKMRQANFTSITFGIETGSDRVMKAMRKSLTVREAREAVRLARQAGIPNITGFFMVGNWGEGVLDVLKTWWFVMRNHVDMTLTVCTPLPGTGFDAVLREQGHLGGDVDWTRVNWVTPLSRTDRMPKWAIAVMYYLTVLLVHLPSSLVRGRRGKAGGLTANIMGFVAQKVRARARRTMPEMTT